MPFFGKTGAALAAEEEEYTPKQEPMPKQEMSFGQGCLLGILGLGLIFFALAFLR